MIENKVKERLDSFLKQCERHQKYHLGYPYNLNCNQYSNLSPFLNFFINNLGDSFVDSNYKIDSRQFEHEVLNFFADLWNIKREDYWGYVTSCGTEGNLLGILYGREYLENPVLVTSKDSHYSVHKSSKMYKIPYHPIDSDKLGELDYDKFGEYLDNRLANEHIDNIKLLIVANIGTTVTGAHDKVKKIKELLKSKNITRKNYYIHCDAALSGCFLPLIKEASDYKFGFDLDVDSISVSGHKFLGTPVPCGIVITKRQHMEKWSSTVEYLNSIDTTITGSRSGFAALAMWYSLQDRGKDGLKLELQACIEKSDNLICLFKEKGVDAWRNPFSITVIFPKPIKSIVQKYQLACQGDIAHIVVTPSVTSDILQEFIKEYTL